jgi:release factor glutamine methyltransferase
VNNIKINIISELKHAGIDHHEAIAEAEYLIEFISKYTKQDFILNPTLELTPLQLDKLNRVVKRRVNERIPVQYLTNTAYFMNEKFFVDENVLIPRPETEQLVNEVILTIDTDKKLSCKEVSIIDVGTGSGCIAVMLAKLLKSAKITAVDISQKALDVAIINAKKHDVLSRINFLNSDIFSGVNQKFDIIASNPPYISIAEKNNLQIEVRDHEPELALFAADEDGISFYERMIDECVSQLNMNGILLFEIGIKQSVKINELLKKKNFKKIEIFKDINGLDRIIKAKFYPPLF